MKKILLETSFSKIYMIVMIIITLLILGGYFSYAMFTVTKEKSNAISIVTGNLTRIARFNFYYLGDLPDGVDIGYIEKDEYNVPPTEFGINLEKVSTAGSSNTYIVRVANTTSSSVTINLGVSVGLDYNDLELPSDGHLLRKITSTGTVKEVIEDDIMNRLNYEDEEQTFVTGSNPYNYIWYSGKLWRAVSIDASDNSVKLVTQWNIGAIPYDDDNSAFEGSYMEEWLNDTTVDGFLGNLRSPEKFIKIDSKWNASTMSDTSKPPSKEEGGTIVVDPVGLLNAYEYDMSGDKESYLNNFIHFFLLTPHDSTSVYYVHYNRYLSYSTVNSSYGIRPSINLKSEIKILAGDGTESNPYRIMGDNDINLEGVKLNTRYSGEYIRFGTGENNLYRIVSHETPGLTKITSAEPLKENSKFKTISFGETSYSSTNTIGSFLNGEYLTSGDYLTEEQVNMIEDNYLWYLGKVYLNDNYKLAKYIDVNMSSYTTSIDAKVGLLRVGELMAGQFDILHNNNDYWSLTKDTSNTLNIVNKVGILYRGYLKYAIKPSLNLKSNVIITSGDGTLQNPYKILFNWNYLVKRIYLFFFFFI